MRSLDFRTGSGFAFTVLPDRAMDISFAEYNGAPLCWRSTSGDVHPGPAIRYRPEEHGYLW